MIELDDPAQTEFELYNLSQWNCIRRLCWQVIKQALLDASTTPTHEELAREENLIEFAVDALDFLLEPHSGLVGYASVLGMSAPTLRRRLVKVVDEARVAGDFMGGLGRLPGAHAASASSMKMRFDWWRAINGPVH